MKNRPETVLKFPCRFPIKAMGKADSDFDTCIVEIIRKHTEDLSDYTVKSRLSRGGRFVSVTIVITALSQAQLDNIYMELSSNERILMAL